jgi:hypothetical protein
LNRAALDWCNEQNTIYHTTVDGAPEQIHDRLCSKLAAVLPDEQILRLSKTSIFLSSVAKMQTV